MLSDGILVADRAAAGGRHGGRDRDHAQRHLGDLRQRSLHLLGGLGPSVSSVTLSSGSSLGGDTVTVLGSGFTAATAVSFGATAATDFTVLSDNALVATVAGRVGGHRRRHGDDAERHLVHGVGRPLHLHVGAIGPVGEQPGHDLGRHRRAAPWSS